MNADTANALAGLALQEIPGIISGIRSLFIKQNPQVPPPTDTEVLAAFEDAWRQSRAKDDAILGAEPVAVPAAVASPAVASPAAVPGPMPVGTDDPAPVAPKTEPPTGS